MVEFEVRVQSITGNVSRSRTCQWVEIDQEWFKITINGSMRNNSLEIKVETSEREYILTDGILERMLSQISEQFANEYTSFIVIEKDGKTD